MEVHHPHHIPKKIKEYITEFIMLFAAVTLGFVAENLREHQIENQRAKEYLELFRTEVVRNDRTIDSLLKVGMPTLQVNERLAIRLLMQENVSPKEIADSLSMYMYRFSNDKRIFELMKNSGSLRLIKDKTLVEEITAYEVEADMAEFRAFDQETSQWKVFFEFIDNNFPGELMLLWLASPQNESISHVNPEFPKIKQAITPDLQVKVRNLKLDADFKRRFGNFLFQKQALAKLSFANYKRVRKKTIPLVQHIDSYLENN